VGIRRVAVRQLRMAAGVGMAHRAPDEENDHLRNRQFEAQVQDQVPALHLHVHVVLWDESPDDAAEEDDEMVEMLRTREKDRVMGKGGDQPPPV